MVTTTTNINETYRSFCTGDAVKRYAESRGIPVCIAVTDALRTPCPLDFCVTGVRDSSKDTPEERAVEGAIFKALKYL